MNEIVPEDANRDSRESGNPASAAKAVGDIPARRQRAGEWLPICAVDDIPRLGARVINSVRGDIALFRNANDEIFALADRCPHKGGRLSQGIVFDGKVACPLHGWTICLGDGKAVAPDKGCVKTFRVKVESDEVFLALGA